MSEKLKKLIKIVILISLIIGAVGGALFLEAYLTPLPEPQYPVTHVRVDEQGNALALENPQTVERLKEDEISLYYRQAVIAIEDHRFYDHSGVDLRGILRAAAGNLKALNPYREGGSTITQQYARNVYSFLGLEKSYVRKIREVAVALRLEQQMSKEEILTEYCNITYMGHGVFGISQGARLFFGKPASELDLNESATLAGVLKSPGYYSPYVNISLAYENRDLVLDKMVEHNFISREQAEAVKKMTIKLVKE